LAEVAVPLTAVGFAELPESREILLTAELRFNSCPARLKTLDADDGRLPATAGCRKLDSFSSCVCLDSVPLEHLLDVVPNRLPANLPSLSLPLPATVVLEASTFKLVGTCTPDVKALVVSLLFLERTSADFDAPTLALAPTFFGAGSSDRRLTVVAIADVFMTPLFHLTNSAKHLAHALI